MSAAEGPILAVDASTLRASAALLGPDDADWGRWRQPAGERGSASLAPAVQALLAARGLAPRDLAGLVVGVGPGSYTGLRSAIAFVRALAFALERPLAGVDSFAMAAREVFAAEAAVGEVVVWLDARRGEAYRADYARGPDGEPAERGAPRLVPVAEVQALDAERHAARRVVREPLPDAYHGAVLGRRQLAEGGRDPATVLPLYLKRSHAEIALDERARRP